MGTKNEKRICFDCKHCIEFVERINLLGKHAKSVKGIHCRFGIVNAVRDIFECTAFELKPKKDDLVNVNYEVVTE